MDIEAIEAIFPQRSSFALGFITYGPDKKGNVYHVDCDTRTEISEQEVVERASERYMESRRYA